MFQVSKNVGEHSTSDRWSTRRASLSSQLLAPADSLEAKDSKSLGPPEKKGSRVGRCYSLSNLTLTLPRRVWSSFFGYFPAINSRAGEGSRFQLESPFGSETPEGCHGSLATGATAGGVTL